MLQIHEQAMKYPIDNYYNFRMGSFTSVPLTRDDIQDLDFEVPAVTTRETLLSRCVNELPKSSSLISRKFIRTEDNAIVHSLPSMQMQPIRYSNSAGNGMKLVVIMLKWLILRTLCVNFKIV